MGIHSAIILFSSIWVVVLFVTLPFTIRTQGEDENVVAGTHASAPARFRFVRTMVVVTAISLVLFALSAALLLTTSFSFRDLNLIDMFSGAGK